MSHTQFNFTDDGNNLIIPIHGTDHGHHIFLAQATVDSIHPGANNNHIRLGAFLNGAGDIAGRFEQAEHNMPLWVRQVYPANPRANAKFKNALALLDSIGYEVQYLSGEAEEVKPKIHLKANFFASGTAWEKMLVRPELAGVMRGHLRYLAGQALVGDSTNHVSDVRVVPEELTASCLASWILCCCRDCVSGWKRLKNWMHFCHRPVV